MKVNDINELPDFLYQFYVQLSIIFHLYCCCTLNRPSVHVLWKKGSKISESIVDNKYLIT